MLENLVEITVDQLLGETQNMLHSGYRFITASCVDNGDNTIDVIYHFDKDTVIKNYKMKVQKETEIPSISNIYFCGLLVENEMKELFGLNITGIAIDYGGHLLLADGMGDSPMLKNQIVIEQRGEKKNV